MKRILSFFFKTITLVVLVILAIYFLTIRSQGEVVSVSIGDYGEKKIAVVPALHDGAVAWMEALFVTDVPTNTPPPSYTPTPDLTRTATKTPKPTQTPTPTGPTPTVTATRTKGPSPTPTATNFPTRTPTTHAYFVEYGEPINNLNTYGASISAASLSVNGRLYLVIADGLHGLLIVDVTDPNNRIEKRYTLTEANSVLVIGRLAYVAAGSDGVVILDLSNPNQPIAIDRRSTIGAALDLDVYPSQDEYNNPATNMLTTYPTIKISVSMGRVGMQILTISPIDKGNNTLNKEKKEIKHKRYSKPVYYDTEDLALGITESHHDIMNEYVFLADGRDGVKVFALEDVNRPIRESDIVHSFDIPYAWDVAFGELLEHRPRQDRQFYWLFVAAGTEGVRVYKVLIESNPREATYNYIRVINTPGEARAVTLYHNNIFVGDGSGGVQVIDFNDPEHPVLMESGKYEFGWERLPIFYTLKEGLYHNVDSPGSRSTLGNIVIDAMLCVGALAITAFFLTSFILPVSSVRDRLHVLRLVIANWLGTHGPSWVVEDGKVRHRMLVEQVRGQGVVLQDPNSAAVFKQHAERRRVSGSPVTLTGMDEHLVWMTELRRRQLFIGPRHDDPDPFKTRSDAEERAEYRARQYRRKLTAANTSDGVEIVPTLRVVYSLQGTDVYEDDEFGYEAGSVTRAYQSERPPAVDTTTDPVKYYGRRQPIENLLEKLVSELWKMGLSRYAIADLFPVSGQTTALETIQVMITNLLVKGQVNVLDGFGEVENIAAIREDYRGLTGGQRPQRSTDKSLPEPGRGIVVHEVSLEAIYLSENDIQRLLQNWIETWRQRNPPNENEIGVMAGHESLIQFAEYAVQYFAQDPGSQPHPQRLVESLVSLLRGTMQALPPKSPEYRRLADAISQLGGGGR